jgi:hypothetical protein
VRLRVIPFVAPYMRTALMVIWAALHTAAMTQQDISDYLERGQGPLSGLPFWGQIPMAVQEQAKRAGIPISGSWHLNVRYSRGCAEYRLCAV